ncbi:MAG: N-acetylmuramoyl-L-alanine amidase [Clostridia bacterium]|nr:N-acetylmuramoyl-L-alanine amidase [Clostridia bacterium]
MFLILRKKRIFLVFILATFMLAVIFSGFGSYLYYGKVAPVLAQGKPLILIDPGHGGRDPGAVYQNIYEKDINLDVAKQVEKILKEKKYRVSMTRTKDTNLVNWKDRGSYQRASLIERARIAEKRNARYLISIHCNSDNNSNYSGPQTFYHSQSVSGKRLAEAIQEELKKVNNTKRQAIPGDYFLINNTSCTAVIVELGYLSNAGDRLILCSPEYKRKLAEAIAKGVEKCL